MNPECSKGWNDSLIRIQTGQSCARSIFFFHCSLCISACGIFHLERNCKSGSVFLVPNLSLVNFRFFHSAESIFWYELLDAIRKWGCLDQIDCLSSSTVWREQLWSNPTSWHGYNICSIKISWHNICSEPRLPLDMIQDAGSVVLLVIYMKRNIFRAAELLHKGQREQY